MMEAGQEASPSCVHCGLCLSACPTYLELGTEMDSPRGRIHLMQAVQDGSMPLSADVVRHLDKCLGCRACEPACPSGVLYEELIETARERIESEYPRDREQRLRRWLIANVFPHPAILRLLLLPLRVLDLMGLLRRLRRASKWVAMLPPLRSWQPVRALTPAQGPTRYRVALLTGCVQQVLFAEINRATVRVLSRQGCAVQAPVRQVCCGALYMHGGDRQKAQACARRNIDVFGDNHEAIIVNAAGCGAMLKEYGRLLADDPAYAGRARAFSAKVRDATEWVVSLPASSRGQFAAHVTYHDACHLVHAQGIAAAPRQLLRQIPGVELSELAEADVCCGSAGSYSLTEPEMAQRLGQRKAANLQATGARYVAVGNPGCAMQIAQHLRQAGSDMEVVHPMELLDRAYRSARSASRKLRPQSS